ncbi:MAG: SCO family protein [Amaricoccus sp.]
MLLWVAVLVALVGATWLFVSQRMQGGARDTLGQGAYALTGTDGTTFTAASLKGHPSAVYFGFTHCPEICPTTLGDIETWQEELGPEAKKLRFWFVTVDPERDGVDMLRSYLSWDPEVVGLSGSRAEIDKAIAAFKIYATKVPLKDGDYTMDHTAYVMLFDSAGRFDTVIGYQESTASAVDKLRKLIARG